MTHYLMLGTYTDKGMDGIEQSPERIKRFKEICQSHGAKMISYYLLMGHYDVACVLEAPSAESVAKIALTLGKRGKIRTETLCAFTEKEQIDMVGKLAQ